MKIFLIILLILSILLESSITTIPFVLSIILVLYIFYRKEWVFLTVFISGVILDILNLRNLGFSSSFFLIFLFLIFLYDRKFEIKSNYFVIFSSFFGSIVYLLIFNSQFIFLSALANTIFAYVIFKVGKGKLGFKPL